MRRQRKSYLAPLNLDSLVDIVSNTVGILIILAIFMALFTRFVVPGAEGPQGRADSAQRPAAKILVPWSHPTSKNSVFFYLHKNRVLALDLAAFYAALAGRSAAEDTYPLEIDLPGVHTRYLPVTNHVFCLEFDPEEGRGETWLEAQAPRSAWNRALAAYPREKFFYFFWVTGDSFEQFRQIRELLWKQQIEVGWKPARNGAPLEICNGFEGSSAFQPQ